ncbi:3-methylcrotonyl-CoA carboxylase, partial [Pseudoalteromonas rubra]
QVLPFADHLIIAEANGNQWQVFYQDLDHTMDVRLDGHSLVANLDGKRLLADVVITEEQITVMFGPYQFDVALKSKHYVSEHEHQEAPLAAPLNGTVVKHLQSVGAQVSKGDPVVVIEAMKMEYTLNAPFDGTLTSYCFDEGELVSHGAMLAIVEEA